MEQIFPEALRGVQLERLKKTLSWAGKKSPLYRNKFRDCQIEQADIVSLEDLERFPFTTLEELQQLPAADFLTLPYSSIVRVSLWEHPQHMIRLYTAGDVTVHVEMMARVLTAAGVHHASVVGILGDMVMVLCFNSLSCSAMNVSYSRIHDEKSISSSRSRILTKPLTLKRANFSKFLSAI